MNALITAKELKESGDEVSVVFDGAGTRWVAALSNPEHRYYGLFEEVRDRIAGACAYLCESLRGQEGSRRGGIALLEEFEQHPSLRSYLADGYQVVTF